MTEQQRTRMTKAELLTQFDLAIENSRLKDQLGEANSVIAAQPIVDTEPRLRPIVDTEPRLESSVVKKNKRRSLTAPAILVGSILVSASLLVAGGEFKGADSNIAYSTSTPAGESATPSTGQASGTPRPSEAAGTSNPEKIGSFDISPIGKDVWSGNIANWGPIKDTNGNPIGAVMTPEPHGLNSIVSTTELTVGQGYWNAKVDGTHQAISLVLKPGLVNGLPLRGVSEYSVLPGQTAVDATAQAFDGQVKLEANTQPNVCTIVVADTIKAIPGNEQDVTNPAAWEAQKITSEQAAKDWGRDVWSQNPDNWSLADDGYGMVLKPNPNGSNSVVEMVGAVGQAYWNAKVEGTYQAIAGTLGVGTMTPIRGVTGYAGVPTGMKEEAAKFAFKQAVNLEIKTQPGVFVLRVDQTACPIPGVASATTEPQTSPTAKPDATISPVQADWKVAFEKSLGIKRAHPLAGFSNGLKIENGPKVFVTITKGERIDTPTGSFNGPWKGPVTVATIWKLASPTANPEPIKPVQTDWKVAFEKSLGIKRAHPLAGFSNGLKIENGPKVFVTITKGERIDTPTGSHSGPWKGYVTVATIWKL